MIGSHDPRPQIRTRRLLYTDDVGRDACGIGGVAVADGVPSREVVEKTLLGLTNLEHRGGVCGEVGDGAGVLFQLPADWLRARAAEAPNPGRVPVDGPLAAGMFFLPRDATGARQARMIVEAALASVPVRVIGWREVPVRPGAIPAVARSGMPRFEQVILACDADDVESALESARLEARRRFAAEGVEAYTVTLSARVLGYKGLLTSRQLTDFFVDLHDAEFRAGLALFHRRFSTNTFPDWRLAQPFGTLCHNGEINTIRANRRSMTAYARCLDPLPPGGDLQTPCMSDSATLDAWVTHLARSRGWSLLRALRLSVPPVWDNEAEELGPDACHLYLHARRAYGSLAAWDGPAGIIATDGRLLVGQVDRMGLRPVRWCTDQRGWLYVGSESGIFGLDPAEIAASGQLRPGEMIAIDTRTGARLSDADITADVVAEATDELGDLAALNREQVIEPGSFDHSARFEAMVADTLTTHAWSIDQWMQAHGWDFERAQFVKSMARLGKEPLSSMGFDRVLTLFSAHHPVLFKYLQQTFAEVTNPPIDPYREGSAMSLTTYVGRPPAASPGDATDRPLQLELPSPVLTDAAFDDIRRNESLKPAFLAAVFPLAGGVDALRDALNRLKQDAERAARDGRGTLIVSQRDSFEGDLVPIPSLLATAVVHRHLCLLGLRPRCSIVVQAGDVQEAHDICCLVGCGADAVAPYLIMRLVRDGLESKDPDTGQQWALTPRECLENVVSALEDGIRKVMAKMGVTTIEGYRGAVMFEAVGLGPELIEPMGDIPSRVGGIGLPELVEDAAWRLDQTRRMTVLSRHRDYHAFNARVRTALRQAAANGHPGPDEDSGAEGAYVRRLAENLHATDASASAFAAFSQLVNHRTPTVLRDVFRFRDLSPIPIDRVESAERIIRDRFRGAAMSHGALTGVAHQTIAAAFNALGALSNSGEGGEARFRNDAPLRPRGDFWKAELERRAADPDAWCLDGDVRRSRYRSRIRQVASGRFGVDAEYLVNADEVQIKMAQGAKPGEGGQLMGRKVTSEIAAIRFARPGTDLISPPPHHDIYSIEDLAQLIHDIKACSSAATVSVKLVAVENIGTIAVGVAKAGADVIEIDGIDGGTGAAMASSKEHCGLPSEMGLCEVHQALVLNGLRHRVRLRVGGGIKNGADVVKYALLGADEFTFGQALMVSVGCIVCKSCHIPNCPTGITGTQGEYKGAPAHTMTYLLGVAQEVRAILARLGATGLGEIVGRCDMLEPRSDLPGRSRLLDLTRFLHPDMALTRLADSYPDLYGPETASTAVGACGSSPDVNLTIKDAAAEAVAAGREAELHVRLRNSDRSVGATLAGLIARTHGREGMPPGATIRIRCEGEAGQSFGAWCMNGMELVLDGRAQDGLGKGMSGGLVCVAPRSGRSIEPPSVAGNNVGYGATGGTIFIAGRAGHRLGIRNSGATIVAEAAGKYACEYMTAGRAVVLGPIENEIGSGMTSGELIVLDVSGRLPCQLHARSVTAVDCKYVDFVWLQPLIEEFHRRTGSRLARWALEQWAELRRSRRWKKVAPLAVARKAEDFTPAGSHAG